MAEYQGKDVELDKPFRLPKGSKKKFGVYVKNDKGNVVMVKFGDPDMEIKRDDPERRKAFRSRHSCDDKKDKTTPGYWSCKFWQKGKSVSDLLGESANIKFYGKDWSNYITIYLSGMLQVTLSYLTNLQPKQIMVHWLNSRKNSGYIKLDSKAVIDKKFHVYISSNMSLKFTSKLLCHEIIHVKQVLKEELTIKDNEVNWLGEPVNLINYDKRKSNYQQYADQPWEKEAYGREEEVYNYWVNSSEYKRIKSILDPDIMAITKGLVTFDDSLLAGAEQLVRLFNKSSMGM